jgi:hypothetical protein
MGGETAELYTDDHRNIFILTAASFVSRLDVLQQQRPALMPPFLIVGWPILVAFAALLLRTQQHSSEMIVPSISAGEKKKNPQRENRSCRVHYFCYGPGVVYRCAG